MTQWFKVQNNPNVLQEMQNFYQAHFPMGVRHFLCEWIEEQQWDQIDETSSQFLPQANMLMQNMLELLQDRIAGYSDQEHFVIRIQLEQSFQKLNSIAKVNPLDLVLAIKNCLGQEKMLIEQAELMCQQQQGLSQNVDATGSNETCDQIQIALHSLLQRTKETEAMSKEMKLKQEQFIISFSEGQHINSQLQDLEKMPVSDKRKNKENELMTEKNKVSHNQNKLVNDLLKFRISIGHKYKETIEGLDQIQNQILDGELMEWKRRQQLAGNGLVINSSSLKTLRQWCEDLADLIWQNRQQIKQVQQQQRQLPIKFPDGEINQLDMLDNAVTNLLTKLVTSTLIVEKQPPQVLKKGGRFGAVLQLLVGEKLNVKMNPPHIAATIINTTQAKQLLNNDDSNKAQASGSILNNSGTMEYQPSTGQLSVDLRNMTLKSIKRNGKKGLEAVTEEKFCIMFQTDFRMGGGEIAFEVWTLSLPVVVTVHGTQECNAAATILWDNGFAEPERHPFVVPDTVYWEQLAVQLNAKFSSSTGKGLTQNNLNYIASKLFGDKDPSKCQVTWSLFNKDNLPGKSFTFWEWFYAIEKLTKDCLKDLWADDTIIGFLSKNQAESCLSTKALGTFLLRFSDSKHGISIALLDEDDKVKHLTPCTSNDLGVRSLADRIKDMDELVHLYPNRDKNAAFSKYYTAGKPCINDDGYVEPETKSTIPKSKRSTYRQDDALSMPCTPDSFVSSPGSIQPLSQQSQSDIALDEKVPISPLTDDFHDMDISCSMDYTVDDIKELTMGEELDLNDMLDIQLYPDDPNLWQKAHYDL